MQEINEIEQNLRKLKESTHKLKRYHDYDDLDYKEIREIENLFGDKVDRDQNKPIRTDNSAFNNNYIEC